MERLTKRWEVQPYPNLAGKVICEYKECDSTKSCENCIHGRYKDRLAAIEDILGDEYDLGELREMVQAKREGRLEIIEHDVAECIKTVKKAQAALRRERNKINPCIDFCYIKFDKEYIKEYNNYYDYAKTVCRS